MILQHSLPYDIHAERPLPGVRPLGQAPWMLVDDAYGAQMRERARLLDTNRDAVLQLSDQGRAAADELLDAVLDALPAGFARASDSITRPDGVQIALDRADPLGTLGHLLQEDLCILEKSGDQAGDQHVLTGAVLCFPASWRLSEKFMRPLDAIHDPVEVYDDALARRVQRLFDGLQVDRPIWRFNALWYDDATLHQPRSASEPRPLRDAAAALYLRSERQCLLRLPQTRAVIFTIHTFVIAAARMKHPG